MERLERYAPYALAALRIVAALLLHGAWADEAGPLPGPPRGAPDSLPPMLLAAAGSSRWWAGA